MISHTDFITHVLQIHEPKVYLELGLYQGETINRISSFVPRCIGVDIVPTSLNANCEFHQKTTDEFFSTFTDRVDAVFIDADHSVESVRKDLMNSVNILNPGGIIFLHDTDPIDDTFFDPGFCGSGWQIVKEIEEDDRFNIVTFPVAEAGVSVVTLKNSTRTHRRGRA
jgi:hypothetical protein